MFTSRKSTIGKPRNERSKWRSRTRPGRRDLAALEDRAGNLARQSRAAATWKAYDSDLRNFRAWCAERGLSAVPAAPGTVASYLADLETTHKPATIRRRLASISVAHKVAGLDSRTGDAGVRAVAAGIRRRHGTAPGKVQAIRTQLIARLVGPPRGVVILSGLAGPSPAPNRLCRRPAAQRARRPGRRGHPEDDHGLRLRLRHSKTDQEGEGRIVGVPYGSHPPTCPVRAWRAWREYLEPREPFWNAEKGRIDYRGLPAEGPAFRAIRRYGYMSSRRLSDRVWPRSSSGGP